MRRFIPFCLAVPALAQAQAQISPMLQALRQHAWPAAEALAAADQDPLAGKLVTFIRLLNDGQSGAAEIDAFLRDNPTWPDQERLGRRYEEALADEPDERRAASLCDLRAPSAAPALLRCAEAWAIVGDTGRATAAARRGWIVLQSGPDQETFTLARWGGSFSASDQQQRFDSLDTAGSEAAGRQLDRLAPEYRALAAARLAYHRRAPDAPAALAALPAGLRDDVALRLAEARYLRRSGADEAALAVWRSLAIAEAGTRPDRRAPFWVERDALARHLLASGDDQDAYFLADDRGLPADQAIESGFLAGWIALQRLHDPVRARAHFTALAQGAHAVITKARACYWLARAQSDADAILAARTLAASWPTTYYGQLAAREAGQPDEAITARIAALTDPPGTEMAGRAMQDTELAHAAHILVAWQDPARAADFLHLLLLAHVTPAERAAVARLALRLGLPQVAVQAARLAGRDGAVLAQSGWPAPVQPPAGAVPPSLALAIMRQESSFDAAAVSAAGAIGLMQLMPGTAAQIIRTQHMPAGPLTDPASNMRLGTAYLGTLLAQFGGNQAYAAAAYNAGPRRVREWIAANGDAPAGDARAMADWIELIPFAETRNYVQRVLENAVVYRARTQGAG